MAAKLHLADDDSLDALLQLAAEHGLERTEELSDLCASLNLCTVGAFRNFQQDNLDLLVQELLQPRADKPLEKLAAAGYVATLKVYAIALCLPLPPGALFLLLLLCFWRA